MSNKLKNDTSIPRPNVNTKIQCLYKVLKHNFKRKAVSRIWEVHTLSEVIAGHGGACL